MITQIEIKLAPRGYGFHCITAELMRQLPAFPQTALFTLYIQQTACALCIGENVEPRVEQELQQVFVKQKKINVETALNANNRRECDIDELAHAKSLVLGTSVSVPITKARLNLGFKQDIYLCKFNNKQEELSLIATIIGE